MTAIPDKSRSSIPPVGFVRVRGAREHNLKNIDVEIPRDALVVFTGVSGSGKSSLAFGTLYAEAQRRYFESVAPYARRLIEQVGVPEVDAIEGLPPAVALQQQRGTPGARSSVGSVTTLSSLVRMLYSRTGSYPPKQPMLFAEDFSPNTVQGACPTCHGLGRVYEVTEKSMVPDDSLTIRERAIAAWPPAWHGQNLRDILVTLGYDVDTPWRDLPKKDRDWILFTDDQPTVPVYAGLTPKETRAALRRKDEPSYQGTFTGARRYVLHTFANTQSALMKKRVSQYMVGNECPNCHGKRLKKEALSVTFAGLDIAEFSQLALSGLAGMLEPIARGEWREQGKTPAGEGGVLSRRAMQNAVDKRIASGGSAHKASPDVRRTPNLSEEKRLAAQRIAAELLERLSTLIDLGLGYLALDRSTPTLSSGELQRLRLATQLSSQLFGVVYVLDEPSAGLHPADGEALYRALQALKAAGNSLFVVEHDLQMMRRADWLVDVGPAAGEAGGHVVYSGPPEGLAKIEASQTRRHLFAESAQVDHTPRKAAGWLRLANITRNNLHQLDVAFPVGCLTAVTGVSGSGKSSLVSQALPELVASRLGRPIESPDDDEQNPLLAITAAPTGGHIADGMDAIRRLVCVDQKPIGRTPRSNLATYTGLFDHVRKLFAETPSARKRRYSAGRFSFNVAQGRCPTCEGEGFVSVELLFLPSVYAPCTTCHGTRYHASTLEITWREKNIADVLNLTVDAACSFFEDEAGVMRSLVALRDIGLGYLRLGQPATELSGGEAQRIKLATELQRAQRGDTLYVLDEPTTGLHPADVDSLMMQLQGLVDSGNTVVLVEHDMRVAVQSDWVIDVGPGAGAAGGTIVASGTPREVARHADSQTAVYLRSLVVT
ncbi:excinuclease ABC subunit UvrA [Paraburkholderia phymatum]|uniref:UvrABC system protein A n=1 Tax=Paraburkholderia phymatum (strain DSM 17167 / CIP 108236 / LMG 21445 / STM815) TaxID=391038 RepID=B2JWM4_PARP8|nr:excinuclease ABC subunit UvrA [Paraburkholderia phymatum]ACC75351.1 excinuclease ABC, A subunit [Paraburkholderia phymatum STM815]